MIADGGSGALWIRFTVAAALEVLQLAFIDFGQRRQIRDGFRMVDTQPKLAAGFDDHAESGRVTTHRG